MASILPVFHWLNREIGIKTLFYADRDVHLLMICRFLRMFAYGAAALILGIFLWINGIKGQQIGYFMTLSLLGDAAISFLLTMMADKIGRRRVLFVGSILMAATGVVFALSKQYWLLLLAAVIGVLTPGAHEVGPFRAVEVCTMEMERKVGLTMDRNLFLPSSRRSRLEQTYTPGTLSFRPSAWPRDCPQRAG